MQRKFFINPSIAINFIAILFFSLLFLQCGNNSGNPTASNSLVPELTTSQVSSVTDSSALCGGTITSDGGSTVTARGVCWGTNNTPTTSDNKTSDGDGAGVFTSKISGLHPVTKYYIRAYATNSAGTGYGSAMSFTTPASVPELTTSSINNITNSSASCGGTITSDGGASVTERGVCWSTTTHPTIYDNKTSDGDGVGVYISEISGLVANTSYYVRAYAKNNVGVGYGNTLVFLTESPETGTMTDQDGNVYQTVKIGNQWWMAENLKVTHYRNGDAIPNVTDNAEWNNLSTGAYGAYNNDNGNVSTYGLLYNWYTVVDSRNIAPTGWHVPTDEEWKQLEMYLGMSQSDANAYDWRSSPVGSKLKATSGWSNNGNGTDESGFSAIPGGCRYYSDGVYSEVGLRAYYWSATEGNSYYSSAWDRELYYGSSGVGRYNTNEPYGFSVRLVRD